MLIIPTLLVRVPYESNIGRRRMSSYRLFSVAISYSSLELRFLLPITKRALKLWFFLDTLSHVFLITSLT